MKQNHHPSFYREMDTFRLVSPAFHDGQRIPRKYTGELHDLSPPLEFYGVPGGAASLALVVEDVDAPTPESRLVPWTHWVVVNIAPAAKGFAEGFSGRTEHGDRDHDGAVEGLNDWKQPGWRGPKAPTSGHRYRFRLFALDCVLHLGHKVTKDKLLDAIDGHVIAEADLTGIF
ncbi:PEBP (phosphatidylethanolamine-binding protein) family protein [Wolffia australiana]